MAPLAGVATGIKIPVTGRPRTIRGAIADQQNLPAQTRSLGRGEFLQFVATSSAAALFTGLSLRSRVRAQQAPAEPDLLANAFSCGTTALRNPQFVGGGVQAEVFSANSSGSGRVVVKLSRANTDYASRSFEHERHVLKILNEAKVPNVERCVGFGEVTTRAGPRQGMVLTPFMPGRNISVKTGCGNPKLLSSQEEERMEKFMSTAVQMLEVGVAGVDVQVLQSPTSNDMLWIDFTEAAVLKGGPGGVRVEGPSMVCPEYNKRYKSPKDAVIGFATEVFLMVPPSSHEAAAEALTTQLQELSSMKTRGVGKQFQDVWAKLPWRLGSAETKRLETVAASAAGVAV
mmetsp:Transcript_36486/g.84176  ORF Transcript_36486/g.84176 Transcript_36486/m.84176 type:complete len:344 (+) Transcript_36486:41-1072(+)